MHLSKHVSIVVSLSDCIIYTRIVLRFVNKLYFSRMTVGDPAREVLKDSCQDLMLMSQHVRKTFDQAVLEFKSKQGIESMNITP